ncbi:MAG: hypothetical protein KKA32_11905 [Actinobacteria bacterium]|nr:hypothetical protein [Actinomycetota bacterium]
MRAGLSRSGFARSLLVEIACTHHEIYDTQPYLGQAVEAEVAWFKEHLTQVGTGGSRHRSPI